VERADVGRPVTEEGDGDLLGAAYCADQAAPAAIGRCAPTMAYEPITPCSTLVRCIEPPLPFISPACRPMSSPSTDSMEAPRASVW